MKVFLIFVVKMSENHVGIVLIVETQETTVNRRRKIENNQLDLINKKILFV